MQKLILCYKKLKALQCCSWLETNVRAQDISETFNNAPTIFQGEFGTL